MAKNYTKEFAKMFGVELNEEFEIDYGKGKTATAVITALGLRIIDTNMEFYGDINRVTLDWLLIGGCHINKLPWKPHINDQYWYTDGHHVFDSCWVGNVRDWNAYKLGNCYRTQEAAESDRDKWIAFYNSNEQINV